MSQLQQRTISLARISRSIQTNDTIYLCLKHSKRKEPAYVLRAYLVLDDELVDMTIMMGKILDTPALRVGITILGDGSAVPRKVMSGLRKYVHGNKLKNIRCKWI